MANRREFLQMGIAASALPISTELMLPNTSSTAENISPSIPIYKMIFDNRYAVARVFAKDIENAGGKTYGIDGDVTGLWYHDLHHRWKKGPVAIAGLTDANALFCLEQLAWSACQMHLIYSTEHKPTDGSRKLVESFPESSFLAAEKIMHYPKREAIPLPPYSSLSTDDINSLVSWVIAPTKRV